MLGEVGGGDDEEARRAAGGVADGVRRGRRGHVDHQLDDVSRRPELPVLPGARDLAEHVLVQIALGVARRHVDRVELVDDVAEHARRRHDEEGVSHVLRVGRVLGVVVGPADRLDEREDLVADRLEHRLGRELLEARPAQVLLFVAEDGRLDRSVRPVRLRLGERVQLVEALDEQEIGQLLDDGQRVRDAAGPHRVPDAVDRGLQLAGDHVRLRGIGSARSDASEVAGCITSFPWGWRRGGGQTDPRS